MQNSKREITKGLDIPLAGVPVQEVSKAASPSKVALLGGNYVGMKPSMLVQVGDSVKLGQPLFSCKKSQGVVYTSPAAGKILEINRGDRRAFLSIVVSVDEQEEQVEFSKYKNTSLENLSSQDVRDLLLESGLWTAIRSRPYSKIPAADAGADALFINATDTNPLALDPRVVIEHQAEDFKNGIYVLSRLMGDKKVYVCHGEGEHELPDTDNIERRIFVGKHPAGLVGTHIHFISPASASKSVWHLDYQDTIAIGRLFTSGKLNTGRVISLAGPAALKPRLLSTRIGADLKSMVKGEVKPDIETRVVSGSPLHGDTTCDATSYLGRYHRQVTLLPEGKWREFLGWQKPGVSKYSHKRSFVSSFLPTRKFSLSTNKNGSDRAMVPIEAFESVMPLDLLPTQLLRSLVTKDVDLAQKLGCLELDEEDLALCTFVSPGKEDFGPFLREVLTHIENEG